MIKKLILISICILLQACASDFESRQIDEGKASFNDGNFKKAFHELLPVAARNNAHAEYAVGYMYYYGYGTAQDMESGIFWMQRSANQGYVPAQKALDLISKGNKKMY
jgi:TPR repeat protein